MNLPVHILDYLAKNKIDETHLFYVVVSKSGEVVDVGNSNQLSTAHIVLGQKIEEFMPVFAGLFPYKKNLYLPNIELQQHHFYNVHMIGSDDLVWILFGDVSVQIVKLKESIAAARKYTTEAALLRSLEYLILKEVGKGGFEIFMQEPEWVHDLIKENHSTLNVEEEFPFLSVYFNQENEPTAMYTGIWTQVTQSGVEIHLNAWLVRLEHEKYILIQPVHSALVNDKSIIQVARENSLAFEQLTKTKEQLQELVRLKDQFVSIVSHDFRSPISTLTDGISMLLDDLNAEKQFDSSHREIIEQIHEELIRLLNYNNKLYNWTKLNLDSIELNITPVSLDLMIANLNGQYDKRLNDKKLTMRLKVCHHVELETDYVLLNQAVSNLVDNAIKFSSPGSEIAVMTGKNFLKITDQGPGISQDTLQAIKQGYTVKSKKGTNGETGTGLGLTIVSKILKTLNFNLDIESEIGKGTSFTISF